MVVLQPVVAVGDHHLPGGAVYQEEHEGDGGQQPQEGSQEGYEEEIAIACCRNLFCES